MRSTLASLAIFATVACGETHVGPLSDEALAPIPSNRNAEGLAPPIHHCGADLEGPYILVCDTRQFTQITVMSDVWGQQVSEGFDRLAVPHPNTAYQLVGLLADGRYTEPTIAVVGSNPCGECGEQAPPPPAAQFHACTTVTFQANDDVIVSIAVPRRHYSHVRVTTYAPNHRKDHQTEQTQEQLLVVEALDVTPDIPTDATEISTTFPLNKTISAITFQHASRIGPNSVHGACFWLY